MKRKAQPSETADLSCEVCGQMPEPTKTRLTLANIAVMLPIELLVHAADAEIIGVHPRARHRFVQARHPGAPSRALDRRFDESDLIPVAKLPHRAPGEFACLMGGESLHTDACPLDPLLDTSCAASPGGE